MQQTSYTDGKTCIVLKNAETVSEIYLCLYLVHHFSISLKMHCVRNSTRRVDFNVQHVKQDET